MTGENMLESLKAKGKCLFSLNKGHRSLLLPPGFRPKIAQIAVPFFMGVKTTISFEEKKIEFGLCE